MVNSDSEKVNDKKITSDAEKIEDLKGDEEMKEDEGINGMQKVSINLTGYSLSVRRRWIWPECSADI